MHKKTKIICTIGPASRHAPVIKAMIENGANVFRLNFSHGSHQDHGRSIKTIRKVAGELGVSVAIMADLQGPKLRTAKTAQDLSITLKKNARVTLKQGEGLCDNNTIYINYNRLSEDLNVDHNILINDGTIRLKVIEIDKQKKAVICRVLNRGSYSSHKGVNFPGVPLKIPALTAKDKKDLQYILTQDINYIALSFVRSAADLKQVTAAIKHTAKPIRLIAKIEKPEALPNIEDILDNCDGIMVARGDLGVETSFYKVPILQKDFIEAANRKAKQVIVATQMLESMIASPVPTRAEAADVANAILDGTDAVMLSGETAIGEYPVEAVKTMASIAVEIEESDYFPSYFVDLDTKAGYPPYSVCEAGAYASQDLAGIPVCIYTFSGDTAFYHAKIRNQSRIFAFTPDPLVAASLAMAWNTIPFVIPYQKELGLLLQSGEDQLLERGLIKPGELVVVVCGTSPVKGATNFMRVKKIGDD